MPPYPEKQSPLLVRLKQKKPLMEAEGENEPSTPKPKPSQDAPKLSDTAVRISKKMNLLMNLIFLD